MVETTRLERWRSGWYQHPVAAHDRWLSSNPDKRWAEAYFLVYSAGWMIAVVLVILTGWIRAFEDVGYLVFSLAVGLPAVVGPLLLHGRRGDGRPWRESFWLKLNVWVFILVAFGTYFGTHYFFDLMGMRYGFPVAWTFDAEVVGRHGGAVPVFMYPLTQAYFVTYYVGLTVVLRWLVRRFSLGRVGLVVALLALSYAVAFAETYFMASPHIAEYFEYADRDRMLAVGSFGYMVYFVIGVPMVRRIDEDGPWPLRRVVLEALATCMMVLCALELWAQLVGPL